jgi:nitrile hydratase accessory protein
MTTLAAGLDAALDDLPAAAAPPRANGQPLFAAPWQSRAFGIVVCLHQQGLFEWDQFKALLIDEIDRAGAGGRGEDYYERWVAACGRLLAQLGTVPASILDARSEDFVSGRRQGLA